jgi:23S rRNA pseudouridine955/2504/2580 synthase
MRKIRVLFENGRCLALDKPAGLAVQGGEGVGASLDAILAAEYSPRPLLVHRLDKDTSGVILAAKDREAAALFSRLFAERGGPDGNAGGVLKRYMAVCAGRPRLAAGVITETLTVRGRSLEARTSYRYLWRGALEDGWEYSVLELEPGTGRMHQIRRHLSMTGNPILGDDKYGDFPLNKRLKKQQGLKRLLLHAARLIIPASLCGFPLDVSAPLPEYFSEFTGDGLETG